MLEVKNLKFGYRAMRAGLNDISSRPEINEIVATWVKWTGKPQH